MTRWLVDALAARRGGTAYAAVQVAAQLAPATVVTRSGSIVAHGLAGRPGVRLVRLRPEGRSELVARAAWEAAALPALARRHAATALLSWSGMLPRDVGVPTVAYVTNPVMLTGRGAGDRGRRLAVRQTLRRVRAVAAPTRDMADRLEAALGRPAHVVPHGVDHDRFRPAQTPGDELLCVGDFYPHKRHDLVLDAWAALPAPRPLLRLVGDARVSPATHAAVLQRARDLAGHGRITVEGGLRLGELVAAFQRARAFVIASERESFCMPLLEALACGVPAVARDAPALRETGGAATAYVPGDDAGAYAAALARLLADGSAHAAARAAGLRHAAGYGWDRTAAGLAALLEGV